MYGKSNRLPGNFPGSLLLTVIYFLIFFIISADQNSISSCSA